VVSSGTALHAALQNSAEAVTTESAKDF